MNSIQPWNRTVRKSNYLIQKSRFSLSLQQQKILLYLISKIQPNDEEFKLYDFSVSEFCRVCGIDMTNGKNYIDVKNAIKSIADKSIWIKLDQDTDTLLRWIEKPYLNQKSGTIRIRLDEDMRPYLLQLKRDFTQYELLWTLYFRSKYSIRLYELVKSIHYHDTAQYIRTYPLETLKELLGAETYKTYQTFKCRVLIPAINEINKYSDKVVSYTPIKQGKSVAKIELAVSSKSTLETFKIRAAIERDFGFVQTSLFDE